MTARWTSLAAVLAVLLAIAGCAGDEALAVRDAAPDVVAADVSSDVPAVAHLATEPVVPSGDPSALAPRATGPQLAAAAAPSTRTAPTPRASAITAAQPALAPPAPDPRQYRPASSRDIGCAQPRTADGPPYTCTCTPGDSCDIGIVCHAGRTTCPGGRAVCVDAGPLPAGVSCGTGGRVCDGAGNCRCPAGQSDCGGVCRPTGGSCSVGVGACARTGTVVCSGTSTTCNATPGSPTTESCNGMDDDCNGTIDDIAPTACTPGQCRRGSTYCAAGMLACSYTSNDPAGTACTSPNGGVCDGAGNCICPAGQSNCSGYCRTTGTACTNGIGACQRWGVTVCSGTGTTCNAVPGTPSPETCNGIDDDCNGTIDDIPPTRCSPGECRIGAQYCSGGRGPFCSYTANEPYGTACSSIVGGVCNGAGSCTCPSGQSNCGGYCRPTGASCSVGVGACRRTGTVVCSGTGTTCSARPGSPSTEVCNGVDDNCDGVVDNIASTSCSPRECRRGSTYCSGGGGPYCSYTSNDPAGTPCSGGWTCNGAGYCCGNNCSWNWTCNWRYTCNWNYRCGWVWEPYWQYVCTGWWWWTTCRWELRWRLVYRCRWSYDCGWQNICGWNYQCSYSCR
jgi:hypothetical protein